MDIDSALKKEKIKISLCTVLLLAILIAGMAASACMGAMDISTGDICRVIANKLFAAGFDIPGNVTAVVWNIRLPRILCAVFVGAGLAVAGVIFQGILQNPLADPYTLGISTGASFGASLAIILNILWGIYLPVPLCALVCALLTLASVISIASVSDGFKSSSLVIAGIIAGSVLSSGVSFIKMLAGENVSAVVFWIMGSLSAMGWSDVLMAAPVVIICTLLASGLALRLDIMALGEEAARSLGVNTAALRIVLLIIGSVMTAVCVCICGVIGFVGLIVPHLLRYMLTAKNRVLMPLSALFGAVLLLCADSAARILASGEIPVGVLTTLIGGPFFIFVFTRRERRGE